MQAAIAGTADPLKTVRFLTNLLEAISAVPALSEQRHDPKLIDAVLKLGLEYAKLKPKQAIEPQAEPLHVFLNTLYTAGADDTQKRLGARELGRFLENFETHEQRRRLLEFSTIC